MGDHEFDLSNSDFDSTAAKFDTVRLASETEKIVLYIHQWRPGQHKGWKRELKPFKMTIASTHLWLTSLQVKSELRLHVALTEIVALKCFKNLMRKNAGKLSFDGYVE